MGSGTSLMQIESEQNCRTPVGIQTVGELPGLEMCTLVSGVCTTEGNSVPFQPAVRPVTNSAYTRQSIRPSGEIILTLFTCLFSKALTRWLAVWAESGGLTTVLEGENRKEKEARGRNLLLKMVQQQKCGVLVATPWHNNEIQVPKLQLPRHARVALHVLEGDFSDQIWRDYPAQVGGRQVAPQFPAVGLAQSRAALRSLLPWGCALRLRASPPRCQMSEWPTLAQRAGPE